MNVVLVQITIVLTIGKVTNSDNYEYLARGSSTDYIKQLLVKKTGFNSDPNSVPCRSLDTQKQLLYSVRDEGVYVCDLCPDFPLKRILDVFIDSVPIETKLHTLFSECFGYCSNRSDCVAFSYDQTDFLCYLYNSTSESYLKSKRWTTVLMTQPIGILENWMYTRHTSFVGSLLMNHIDDNFLTCLARCDEQTECNYVSYSFKTSECFSYTSEEKIESVHLHYGSIAAVRISSLPVEGNEASKFLEDGDDLLVDIQKNGLPTNTNCSDLKNGTHSAFFSKECFTSGEIACNSLTGCKTCYYPEKTEEEYDLPFCPDSQFVLLDEIELLIDFAMKKCLGRPSCIGVGYSSKTKEVRLLTFDNVGIDGYSTRYLLRHPVDKTTDAYFMKTYDFSFGYEIMKLSNKPNSFHQTTTGTLTDCLLLFQSNAAYIRMSYGNDICKVSSEEVLFRFQTNGNFVGSFKKPSLRSPLVNYVRAPGFSIPPKKAKQTQSCNYYCEAECALKCNQNYKDWCSHFSIQFNSDNDKRCFFFNFLDESLAKSVELKPKENEQVFLKLSNIDFSLDALNQLKEFQPSDIYHCFHVDESDEETLSPSDPNEVDNATTVGSLEK